MPEKVFPEYLSKPAQRALAQAGFTSLEKLTKVTKEELLELHGVGKATIPLLQEDLKAHSKSFKKSTK